MSDFSMNFPQAGSGLYGWDLVNPYLQKRYGQPDSDEEDDDETPEPPDYIAPLPGEKAPASPFKPKYETKIPLQPAYPVNPEPREQEQEEPRKLRSLTEGINLAGERIWNDLKYSKGYIQDKLSDKTRPKAGENALGHLPEYESSTDEELDQRADSLQNEINSNRTEQPQIELKGLEEYRRLREKSMPLEDIAKELSQMVERGNEGRRLMDEALDKNNSFPETEGMATIGDVLANVGRSVAPVAAGSVFPPAGVALGVANVSSSVAESHAQAQMELDNFEKETGTPLSKAQRAGFIAACMGADFIFDVILQSRYLKNLKSGFKKKTSEFFKKSALLNYQSRAEMKKLLDHLSNTERFALINGVFDDAMMGGLSGLLSSVAHDMGTMIYSDKENYPELNSIMERSLQPMLTGGLGGAAAGSLGRTVNFKRRETRRRQQGPIHVLDVDGDVYEVIDYDPQTRKAKVLSSDGQKSQDILYVEPYMIRTLNIDNNRSDRRAVQRYEPDPYDPIIPDPHKDAVWRSLSTREKYKMVKDLAQRMGLDDVLVYERESDLPKSAQSLKKGEGRIGGYFSMDSGEIAVVLENMPSYEVLQNLFLHEAVAHKGLQALFGNAALKNKFLMNVYNSMPATWKLSGNSWNARLRDAEEYLARMAETGVKSNAWDRIYSDLRGFARGIFPNLKISESEMRNILIQSRNALKQDDTIHEMNKKMRRRSQDTDLGRPLTETDPENYRRLWEQDPEWQRYKRFYDEVYGDESDE